MSEAGALVVPFTLGGRVVEKEGCSAGAAAPASAGGATRERWQNAHARDVGCMQRALGLGCREPAAAPLLRGVKREGGAHVLALLRCGTQP
jgi:hypothetical protein